MRCQLRALPEPGQDDSATEKLVQEILDPLSDFPAHLDLTEQGLFALGYYHQTRAFYTKKDPSESTSQNEGEES